MFAEVILYCGHPQDDAACAARRNRLLECEDEAVGAFRQIDLFATGCCFRGLQVITRTSEPAEYYVVLE